MSASDAGHDHVVRMPRSRLPSGCVVHTLAFLVLAAELIGTVASLLGPEPGRRPGVTPAAPTCCALVQSSWPAPGLVQLIKAVRSDAGARAGCHSATRTRDGTAACRSASFAD